MSEPKKDSTIYLIGELDEPTVEGIIRELIRLDDVEEAEGIDIMLCCPGGPLHLGLAVVDVMRSLAAEVTVTAAGTASSAAALILACADRRLIYEHTDVIIHAARNNSSTETARDMRETLGDVNLGARLYAQLIQGCAHTLSQQDVEAVLLGDAPVIQLVGEQVVAEGLADAVIRPSRVHARPTPDAPAGAV